MQKKDFSVAFSFKTWETLVEDHEHSGHTSADWDDENVETQQNSQQSPMFHSGVQWHLELPIWNMSVYSMGGLKT
jgi:hypothetical protein